MLEFSIVVVPSLQEVEAERDVFEVLSQALSVLMVCSCSGVLNPHFSLSVCISEEARLAVHSQRRPDGQFDR